MLIYLDTSTFKRDWSSKILRGDSKLLKLEVAGGWERRLWPENLHKLRKRERDRVAISHSNSQIILVYRVPLFDNFHSVSCSFGQKQYKSFSFCHETVSCARFCFGLLCGKLEEFLILCWKCLLQCQGYFHFLVPGKNKLEKKNANANLKWKKKRHNINCSDDR